MPRRHSYSERTSAAAVAGLPEICDEHYVRPKRGRGKDKNGGNDRRKRLEIPFPRGARLCARHRRISLAAHGRIHTFAESPRRTCAAETTLSRFEIRLRCDKRFFRLFARTTVRYADGVGATVGTTGRVRSSGGPCAPSPKPDTAPNETCTGHHKKHHSRARHTADVDLDRVLARYRTTLDTFPGYL